MWVATKCGKDDQDLESISTHASSTASRRHAKIFQLTPPMWVATPERLFRRLYSIISTHTTHVGGDTDLDITLPENSKFQLTSPIRAATMAKVDTIADTSISTHATHKGGDFKIAVPFVLSIDFNSRHP